MTADERILVGLVGEGIGRSLTPPMHMREAEALGLRYEYRIHDLLASGERADAVGAHLERARHEGYAALNITHPCKQVVIDFLDELTPDAERLQAVNLVVIEDGRFVGSNVDWTGFRDGVRAGLPGAALGSVLQYGSGGAGAATAYAMLTLGTERLRLVDVEVERARSLATRLGSTFPGREILALERSTAEILASVDGVVHATPLGMATHPGVAFDVAALRPDAWVADVVYRPIDTELLRGARARGLRVLDGGRMAVGQAFESLRRITGRQPDAERMRRHFLELVRQEDAASAG